MKKRKLPLKTSIVLGMSLILLPIVLFSLFKPSSTQAVWMDDAWNYRTSLTFTHNATVSSATKVKFDIDTATLITAGKMQSDCGDSRFTDINGKILPYYIDSAGGACNTSSTDYYVLIPSIINGTNVIYHYYGNANATDGTVAAQFSQSTTTPSGGAASTGSEEKGTGPLAYWSMDQGSDNTCSGGTNDVCDSGPQRYDAAFSGTATWKTEDLCVSGKCVYFDGSSGTANAGNQTLLNFERTNAFSVSAWIRTTSTSAQTIISKMGSSAPYKGWNLQTGNGSGYFHFQLTNDYGGNKFIEVRTTNNTNYYDGKWHKVEVTYSGNSAASGVKIYMDGVSLATTVAADTLATNSIQNSTSVYIGSRNAGEQFFAGFIDELKVYNYELSAAQIRASYNSLGTNEGISSQFGAYNQKSLSDGLVGYWKMDEASWTVDCSTSSVTDSSGNGNNGKACPNSTGPAGGSTGKFGNAGSFDGSNDYVEIGDPASGILDMGTGDFSYGGWFKTSTATQDRVFIGKYGGSQTYWARINNGNVNCFIRDSSTVTATSTGASYNDGVWHHILCVRTTSLLRLYVDGVLIDSQTATSVSNPSNSSSFQIGAVSSLSEYYTGSVDEVRVYNKALSAQEVRNLYNWAPGPLGYWKLDEAASSTTVADSSGNGLTGTISNPSGAAIVAGATGKFGRALDAPSNDQDSVSISSSSLLNDLKPLTFSAWVYPKGTGAIFGKEQYAIGLGASNSIEFSRTYSTTSLDVITSNSSYTTNAWQHVAVTWDGTTSASGVKIYVNGIEKTYQTQTNAVGTLTTDAARQLSLVSIFGGNGFGQFYGYIDEARVYNYVRTQQQIVEDMNGGHPTGGSPIGSYVSYWPMDETNGTTAHDANTTFQNDLTLSTATSAWTRSGKINSAWIGTGTNWISRTDDDDLDFTRFVDFSFSFWFKSTSASNPGATEYLINKYFSTGYAVYATTGGNICLGIDDDSTWGPDDSACSASDIYDGTWHHIVAEKNGITALYLYVDGKLSGSDTSIAGSNNLNNSNTFYVGDRDGSDNGDEFNGSIDELKIYRSLLTQDQILFELNAGSSLSFGVTSTASESAQLSDGAGGAPIGWWKMDEASWTNNCSTATVIDSSGNNYSGKACPSSTGPSALDPHGKIGRAGSFDGSNDYVDTGVSAPFELSDLTITGWIKTSAASGANFQGIAGTYQSGVEDYVLALGSSGTCQNKFVWFVGATGWSNLCSTTTVNDGAWHFFAVTYKSSQGQRIYVDGRLDNSNPSATGAIPFGAATNFTIGGYADGTKTFTGLIDDVKVYNYSRTAAQIAYDYNRGGPVGWWQFDECQGSTVYDNSGNGNNGTITIGGSGTQTSVGTCNTSSTAWGNGASGKYNSSLYLDGTDDYVTIPASSATNIDGKSFSISVWSKTSTNTFQQMVSKGTTAGTDRSLQLTWDGDQATLDFYSDGIASNTHMSFGVWHHIVGTYDVTTNTKSLYVDGKFDKSVTTGSSMSNSDANNWIIGKASYSNTWYYTGQIDDVRIFNYALSPAQVRNIYDNGSSVYFGPSSGQP